MLLGHLEVKFLNSSTTWKSSYDSLPKGHISEPMHVSSSFSSEKLQCVGSEKESLRSEQVHLTVLAFSSSPLHPHHACYNCGPLLLCCGTSLLTGISWLLEKLWLHLDWHFSMNVITFLLWFWHCVCIYIHIYMYICIYVCVCVCIDISIYKQTYLPIYDHTHTHTHTHTHIYINV